jgi:TolB-like protein/Flp pilus assembly protein TadD
MFTDMVGYTALMQQDEQKAIELRRHHRQVLEETVELHQGKILQYFGDGTLAIFNSAIRATKCALQIQRQLQQEPKVPLRIGMHLADIVYNDEGVYGDGVNVAARIESLSVPGGVLMSQKVRDELISHPDLKTVSLGPFDLKNVALPVEVFALANEGLVVPAPTQVTTSVARPRKSIAVLPFVNMSTDPENEYFSDGMTEEILNALARIKGLRVTSRTSAFAFKGKNEDVREIGAKLNVDSVLEGSVRKAGSKVRITAQLINTADGYHVWSETYDRELQDIFQVQDEISHAIAGKHKEYIDPEVLEQPLVNKPTENLDAYNLYLKSVYHWNTWTPDGAQKALECAEQAIQLDPEFVLAHSGLASAYVYLGVTGQAKPRTVFEKGRQHALRAIELNDAEAESHIALGLVKLLYDWDWDSARMEFEKALELNPNSSSAMLAQSLYLNVMERFDESIRLLKRAVIIDPLNLPQLQNLGETYYLANQLEEAKETYEKVLEMSPTFRAALNGVAMVHLRWGEFQKAIEIFQESRRLTGDELKGATNLGFAYAMAGEKEKAEDCLRLMREREARDPGVVLSMDYAFVYEALGEYDRAIDYLEKAYEERIGAMAFVGVSRSWSQIHDHPRFKALLRKMGLG